MKCAEKGQGGIWGERGARLQVFLDLGATVVISVLIVNVSHLKKANGAETCYVFIIKVIS